MTTTRTGHDPAQRYRTFWPRLWAGLVDGVVLAPVGLAGLWLLAPERNAVVIVLWGAITFALYPAYSIALHASSGQTVGKRLTGVKVLDVSERAIPTLAQAARRDIVPVALSLIGFIALVVQVTSGDYASRSGTSADGLVEWFATGWYVTEIITMLFSEKRRALHDLIAGTVVVRT